MVLMFGVSVKAQTALPGSYGNYLQQHPFAGNNRFKDSTADKKWFISKYAGISSGVSFFNGGSATVLAIPAGIQLTRRLTDNWYAFAGVSVAPTYINFDHSFQSVNTNKSGQANNFLTSNRFDMYSRAELGLMYINDQKTFSISGSIGIERSSYPVLPYSQINNTKTNHVMSANR